MRTRDIGDDPRTRRARTGAASVFPVPAQRLAVVDLGNELHTRPHVGAMSERLNWSVLHLHEAEELGWALTVNRPAAVLVIIPADLPPDPTTVARVRRATRAPIAVLADVTGPQSVALISAGADTVLSTSTREEEMGARVLALVRRAAEGSDAGARYLLSGPLRVDLWQREATLDTEPVRLTNTEFKLLVCLMEAGGQVVPASRLTSRVWGWAGGDDGLNTLRIGVGRLRRKLGDTVHEPRFVLSVRGSGYRFGGQVTEVGAREEERRTSETGSDLLLAERLARRCEELASAPDARSAASLVARSLVQEGTVDAIGLHLLDGDRLQLVAHHGFSAAWQEAAQELRLADSGFAAVRTLTAEEPVQLRRFSTKAGYARTAALAHVELPGTYLFVPLRSGSSVVGAMGLHRHSSEPFGPLSITYLKAVAALCGVCLSARWRTTST
ncbi:winged helix-turn-helix domain-containing protein [Streptomyces brevispora]|uniref:DNA-binding response OmpR family regulator n=1 Tax=Streptomyces brevispora TaxID=887462 RepID=A0A561TYR4_9ACTN|nr:winged helix-turn-helix domain-containing protein [Streptomyces brevispora]TWF92249.1 DNA-binding response OmpR family regulator [Streptomyces brevispora]WSC11462.1 winged helix-turn-helix domain-containing protein [Streptomyces brevispora]WSC17649.1 winged helix-turn-helix domain-containing protein [Streptomyces brevispora]